MCGRGEISHGPSPMTSRTRPSRRCSTPCGSQPSGCGESPCRSWTRTAVTSPSRSSAMRPTWRSCGPTSKCAAPNRKCGSSMPRLERAFTLAAGSDTDGRQLAREARAILLDEVILQVQQPAGPEEVAGPAGRVGRSPPADGSAGASPPTGLVPPERVETVLYVFQQLTEMLETERDQGREGVGRPAPGLDAAAVRPAARRITTPRPSSTRWCSARRTWTSPTATGSGTSPTCSFTGN